MKDVKPAPKPPAGVFFTLDSAPSRARIIDQVTQVDVGTTPHRVEVFAKAAFVLKKPGYRDFVLELDPASAVRELAPKLIPRPKRPSTAAAVDAPPPPSPVIVPAVAPDPVLPKPALVPDRAKDELPMEFN